MVQATTTQPLVSDERDCETDAIHPAAVMAARRALGDAPVPDGVAAIFAILGDPTRIRVLTALASGELCVCDLAPQWGQSQHCFPPASRAARSPAGSAPARGQGGLLRAR